MENVQPILAARDLGRFAAATAPGCCATCRSTSAPASGSSSWGPRGVARRCCCAAWLISTRWMQGRCGGKERPFPAHRCRCFGATWCTCTSVPRSSRAPSLTTCSTRSRSRSTKIAGSTNSGWSAGCSRWGGRPSSCRKSSRDLSGGEAQITALLRAMQLEPDVLLLDEPTAALDQAATQAVEQCAMQWCREDEQQRTVVWVSHNQEQAARMADRVITMDAGRIVSGA